MFNFILRKIVGTQNERQLKAFSSLVEAVGRFEEQFKKATDEELKKKTDEFKKKITERIRPLEKALLKLEEDYKKTSFSDEKQDIRLEIDSAKEDFTQAKEEILDEMMPEAFAIVREAGKRTVSMRHFDVQITGGAVLHKGKIAEMATGEGKTLVATLSAYLNALTGKGVHIVTVNDYLAKRDRYWMGPLYEFLGLTCGFIQHDMEPSERKKAYACDITYGTNNEFGFDYLRDNMVVRKEDMVQGRLHYAIVDEVDSILIDEARTPLIISGPAEESTDKYYTINKIYPKLKGKKILDKDEVEAKYKGLDIEKGVDYLVNEKNHTVSLTEEGVLKCQGILGVKNLYDDIQSQWEPHIRQMIRAHDLYRRDVNYVVKDGEVLIVDEFTGRLMPGRRYSDGLHQALEAKEGVKIERENQTLATVTFQNYFRMYDKLAGMTGTAETEAPEFKKIYSLDVIVIPTNKPLARTNHSDVIYKTEKEKFNAICDELASLHKSGRPVLVGTISIERNELLSRMLKSRNVPHHVLNAKYHEREAEIVAQAGRLHGVTIATNMAGRGTDILLGGNPEFMVKAILSNKGMEPENIDEAEYKKLIQEKTEEAKKEHDKVVELGGLHVLGTERHEARRIDNQLRGRSGRQGDPGSSRFYLSLEDDLMRIFGSDRIKFMMDKLGMEEGQDIQHPLVSKAVETAQRRVEGLNFDVRKHLLEYDNVMNKQREIIYEERKMILESSDLKPYILSLAEDVVSKRIEFHTGGAKEVDEWDTQGLLSWLKSRFFISAPDVFKDSGDLEKIEEDILHRVRESYEKKRNSLGAEIMHQMEKMVLLQSIDSHWKDHLYGMDSLREGIGLRAYGQRDPLIEYQHEGFAMFTEMIEKVKEQALEFLFKVKEVHEERKSVFDSVPQKFVHEEVSALGKATEEHKEIRPPRSQGRQRQHEEKAHPYKREEPKVGRNDPCPCGSGKKYKRCCGK